MNGEKSYNINYKLKYFLVYILFLIIAIIQLRSLISYYHFWSLDSFSNFILMHPIFGLINPYIFERWFFDLYDVILIFMYPFGPNIIDINFSIYFLIISLSGFSFFIYSKTIFNDLGFPGKNSFFVSILSGIFYMSNPFFLIGDLFWTGDAMAYAILPLILLFLHNSFKSDDKLNYFKNLIIFSLLFSFVMVEDSSHILTFGIIALFYQILITRSIIKIKILKSVLTIFIGIIFSVLLIFPTFIFLFFQHYIGNNIYFYSGPVNKLLVGPWINAYNPIWIIANNIWFNRELIFSFLGNPIYLILASEIFLILLLALSISTLFLSKIMKKNFSLPILMISTFIIIFILYSNFGTNNIIFNLFPPNSLFLHIFSEGYIPEFFVTLIYSILPEYLLLLILENNKILYLGKGLKKYFNIRNILNNFKLKSFEKYDHLIYIDETYIKINKNKLKKIVAIFIIFIIILSSILMAFPSYILSDSTNQGIGYVIPVNSTVSDSLELAINYLENSSGSIIWIPNPPLYGAFGSLIPRSYSYPYGSDGPITTELFDYLFGNTGDSLLNSGNYYALAKISALLGIKYIVFYGNSYIRGFNLVESPYFLIAKNYKWVLIVENRYYSGPIYISSNALLISGGLSLYSSFLHFEKQIYNNYTIPIPFLTDSYPFFNLTGNYSILTNNLNQLLIELSIMKSGFQFLSFPYLLCNLSTTPNNGWFGVNAAGAGGYWDLGGTVATITNSENFSWQSLYTVNDGVVLTNKQGTMLNFKIQANKGTNEILIRVFTSPSFNSNFTITVNSQMYKIIMPSTTFAHFVWVDLGQIKINKNFTKVIISSLGKAAINAIAIIPYNTWKNSYNFSINTIKNHAVYLLPSPGQTTLNITSDLNYTIIPNKNFKSWSAEIITDQDYYVLNYTYNDLRYTKIPLNMPLAFPYFGNNSKIILKGNSCLTNNGTISVWVKFSSFMNRPESIVYQNNLSNMNQINFNLALSSANYLWGNIMTNKGWQSTTFSSVKLDPNVWYNLIMSFNNTILNIYLNETLVGTLSFKGLNFTPSNDYIIGGYPKSPFNGIIGSLLVLPQYINETLINYRNFFSSIKTVAELNILNTSNTLINFQNISTVYENISSLPSSFLEMLILSNYFNFYNISLNSKFFFGESQYLKIIYYNKSLPFILVSNFNKTDVSHNLSFYYRYFSTSSGNLINKIFINNSENSLNTIYVLVPSNLGSMAIASSYVQIKNLKFETIPALIGVEAFEINLSTLNSNNKIINISIYYNQNNNLIIYENLISYITLFTLLTVYLIILFIEKKKFRRF